MTYKDVLRRLDQDEDIERQMLSSQDTQTFVDNQQRLSRDTMLAAQTAQLQMLLHEQMIANLNR